MSARKPCPRGLGAALAALPLLLPAVSALVPADVVWAATPRQPELQALAQAVARGDDRVAPEHLRGLLGARRGDFTLIDIRSPEDFARGHIPGALNVPMARLSDPVEWVRLRKSPQVIVASQQVDQQAQAAALLRVAGVPALELAGGLAAWAHAVDAWSASLKVAATGSGAASAASSPAAPPIRHGAPCVNLKGMCS